jgi:hypothetical protein
MGVNQLKKIAKIMKRIIYLFVILAACRGNEGKVAAEVEQYLKNQDSLPVTNVMEDVPETKAIKVTEVKMIDSTLFERSIFRDLGCARDFWFDRKGPECCCEDLLTNYTQVVATITDVKRIAAINAKDPIIKKCRSKVNGWSKRFDAVTNPPETEKVPPSEDEGL